MKQMMSKSRDDACIRCGLWGVREVDQLAPDALLDVGCGDSELLMENLTHKPRDHYAVEGDPIRAKKSEDKYGVKVRQFDLNGYWDFEDELVDVIHCSQVIEHVHNSRLFIKEMLRCLRPGGTAIVSSENLVSLLNTIAVVLGYVPFPMQQVCGLYCGNPLGQHDAQNLACGLKEDDPAYSGATGHNRVFAPLQAKTLFEDAGFIDVEVGTMGLILLPDDLSAQVERIMPRRGHMLTIKAKKRL